MKPRLNVASTFQLCHPVEHDGQRRCRWITQRHVDQKALTVASDVVECEGGYGYKWHMCFKERLRHARLKARPAVHRHCHHLAVRRHVVQLFAVLSPLRLPAASSRDLPPRAGRRKGRDIDFIAPCFIAEVSEPAPVWRKPRPAFKIWR